ncbi:MAG: hypothetical protein ACR2LX_07075 [Jatrophihabitans sp.]
MRPTRSAHAPKIADPIGRISRVAVVKKPSGFDYFVVVLGNVGVLVHVDVGKDLGVSATL